MNKRIIIAELNKIANELDNSGKFREASEITDVMKRVSQLNTDPEAAVTNAQVAFQGLGNAMSQPKPTSGDTANEMQAQNTMPAESSLYQQAINQIAELLKTKNPMSRTQAQKIYEDTFVQLKDPKRKQAFANQFQRLVSQNFAAKYNQGPTQQ